MRRLLVLSLLAACAFASVVRAQAPMLTAGEQRQVVGWLRCNDCTSHERDTVVAIAVRKPPATIDTLARNLARGAPAALLNNLRLRMTRVFVRDSIAAAAHGRKYPPRAVLLQRFVGGIDLTWRLRCAEALGYINVPRSDSVLAAFALTSLDPHVLRLVRYAKDSLPTP